jgi:hypothetical protein
MPNRLIVKEMTWHSNYGTSVFTVPPSDAFLRWITLVDCQQK